MAVTAFSASSAIPVTVSGGVSTVVIKLRLPHTGTFVVWGKATVTNSATTVQGGQVQMTTLDGATVLDIAGFSFAPAGLVTVPLQSTLDLSHTDTNEIVDIRCITANGTVSDFSLIAIPVDALSGPAAPGT
jgi:hypothetical protein